MDNIRIISPGTNAKALASFNENFKQMVAAYTRLPFHLGEEKILSFKNSLNEMREYEKNHNIQKHSIEEMTYYADHANEYAGKWIDGYFDKK